MNSTMTARAGVPSQPQAKSEGTRTGPPASIAVLINPAAGRDRPILAPLNRALNQAKIPWDVRVLQPNDEAEAVRWALAQRPDLVLVYGGDGTMSHVVTEMLREGGPLPGIAPLAGGTANALAEKVQAPAALEDALQRICEGEYEIVVSDVGMVGDRAFILRATIGVAAGLTNRVSREEKDRWGLFAYGLSGLRALRDVRPAHFRLVADGRVHEYEAVSIVVANSAGTGLGTALASSVKSEDQLLDVIVVPSVGWVTRALAQAALGEGLMDGAEGFQCRQVRVDCDIPMIVQLDGEESGYTPVDLAVRAAAVRLVHYRNDD